METRTQITEKQEKRVKKNFVNGIDSLENVRNLVENSDSACGKEGPF